jgi:hypothetical protein
MYLASPNSYIERLAAEEKHIINHSRATYMWLQLSPSDPITVQFFKGI